jgi:hypothetical protein
VQEEFLGNVRAGLEEEILGDDGGLFAFW